MNFDKIRASTTERDKKAAAQKIQSLSLELGVREDNGHVGTGMGGNKAQLLALMAFQNELINEPGLTIRANNGLMEWGIEWFLTTSKKDIRQMLDVVLPIAKYTPIDDVRSNPAYSLGPNVSRWSVLSLSNMLCQKLASELDNGNTSGVQATAFALVGFPQEFILLSVREHIQIERLVKHNLDEHPDFGKILHKINKEVDN